VKLYAIKSDKYCDDKISLARLARLVDWETISFDSVSEMKVGEIIEFGERGGSFAFSVERTS
jgi:hypothetical protein